MKIFSWTQGLCATCGKRVDAQIVAIDGRVYLDKYCVEHGNERALICSDSAWYENSLRFVKPSTSPKARNRKSRGDCVSACGLCENHQQHTCLPVVEITDACNLQCPICLKDFNNSFSFTATDFSDVVDNLLRCEGEVSVLNISGGEPTMHPQLGEMLASANEKGVVQTTISTNGLRLLDDQRLVDSLVENDTLVALQFDGFRSSTYQTLRGEDLVAKKLEVISLLEQRNISYSIVATIAAGINDDEIADIADTFFTSQAHSLMFQPVTYTGQARFLEQPAERITIPAVIAQLDRSKYASASHFNPLPCSHPACFALSYYFKIDDEQFFSMREFLGESDYLDVIANRTLPGLDAAGYETIKNRVYDMWSAGDQFLSNDAVLDRIRRILRELSVKGFTPKNAFDVGRKSLKAIFIHQFMDVHTFDFGRLKKCCNHYPQVDNRLVPMCGYNVLHQGAR